jgi:hypothetical protein
MERGPRRDGDQQGVALLTVLLFTALMFILVSAMLLSAGKEILIAGLHRDAVMAEEFAQAGLEDVLRRMEGGRPWKPGAVQPADRCEQDDGSPGLRAGLPETDTCDAVVPRSSGASGSILEVRSNGTAGRARRRVAAVVAARTLTALPETLVVHSLTEPAGSEIGSGVVHARAFAAYASDVSARRTTYAGWRIEHRGTGAEPGAGCYTHAECVAVGRTQWWPGHRWAVHTRRPLRPGPLPGNVTPDLRIPGAMLGYACPAGAPAAQAIQTIGTDGPGYQPGDLRADLHPSDPGQSAIAAEPLYGCTGDGLPYTWVREAFDTGDDPDSDPDRALWFRALRLDQWLARYACFDERALAWVPCNGFHPDPALGDPGLAAVLPLPPGDLWAENYDQRKIGGGPLTPADLDFGRCVDPPICAASANVRPTVVLAEGDYTLICPGVCPDGLGVLVVGGDLTITGALTYRGSVVVGGALSVPTGSELTIHGRVSARSIAGSGVLRLTPGTSVAVGVAGPAGVARKAWWER